MRQLTVEQAIVQIRHDFCSAAHADIAPDMAKYMKNVSPFLGLKTPERRALLKPILKQLGPLDPDQLLTLIDGLYALPEREYKYAACDVLARFEALVPASWLDRHIRRWLLTEPWWDTVDSIGNAIISPLTLREPTCERTMWKWLQSEEMWLQRAAIGHQRGRRLRTDVPLLVSYLHEVADDRRFFIAKAVGWALRDLSAIDLAATKKFVLQHPNLPPVARREAQRGIERASSAE